MTFNKIPTWPEWQRASSSFMETRAKKPLLVQIDDLIKRYHQVLDMSRLNILMELKNAIAAWAADKIDRGANTGRLAAMQALEEVVLRTLKEQDQWGLHRYVDAVCIGYKIAIDTYTSPKNAKDRVKNEKADIANKCAALTSAIDVAYQKHLAYLAARKIGAIENSKILKIFVAPEFFFRGSYGAYQDIGWLSDILTTMRTETSKGRYADWLFVLGTAVFQTIKEKPTGAKNVKEGLLLENFALVQKGGPKQSERHEFIVEKEFPSHVDFREKSAPELGAAWYDDSTAKAKIAGATVTSVKPDGLRKDPIYNPLDATHQSVSELVGGSIFTISGITIGLEVCRDHYLGRLAHSQENGTIQIQLIPAGGMTIKDPSIATVANGIVFNVDSAAPGSVNIKVKGAAQQPNEVLPAAKAGKGEIRLFEKVAIPYPGTPATIRPDVAARLNVGFNRLQGIVPPPIPPKPGPPNLPNSVKKFGVPVLPPTPKKP